MDAKEKDLLIEIHVTTDDGREKNFTGYPVAPGRILTTRHGLFPDVVPESKTIELRWHELKAEDERRRWQPATVIWEDEALDAVLLQCDFPDGLTGYGWLSDQPPRETNPPTRWASAVGRDRFGLWCEIAVEPSQGEPVIQRLRWIPPGQFWMGSPAEEPGRFNDEGPRHQVMLAEGYWLFDTPCTQALWEAVMRKNPSHFQSPTRPVEQVSWNDIHDFLAQLNARIPGLNLVLPSEAQWEYACRAGTETAIYIGNLEILGERNAPALDPIAWYGGNCGVDFELDNGYDSLGWKEKQYPHTTAGTHPVKLKQANPWGLYDLLGNIWEWTQDPWHENYQDAPTDGSAWEDQDAGANRVLRGGSWIYYARGVRAAYRNVYHPDFRLGNGGFRCAREFRVSPASQQARAERPAPGHGAAG